MIAALLIATFAPLAVAAFLDADWHRRELRRERDRRARLRAIVDGLRHDAGDGA